MKNITIKNITNILFIIALILLPFLVYKIINRSNVIYYPEDKALYFDVIDSINNNIQIYERYYEEKPNAEVVIMYKGQIYK